MAFDIRINTGLADDLLTHLNRCSEDFSPPLSQRVSLDAYTQKLMALATRVEAWADPGIVGLLAFYQTENGLFISNLSIDREYRRTGLATGLLQRAASNCALAASTTMALRVGRNNRPAIGFYSKQGFIVTRQFDDELEMQKTGMPSD